jgi:aminopeptidase N
MITVYRIMILVHISINIANAQSWKNKSNLSREDTLRGTITEERKWWDVLNYNIMIKPDYKTKTVKGYNEISYKVINVSKKNILLLDLQPPLSIDSILYNKHEKLSFEKKRNSWFVNTPEQNENSVNSLLVYYSGTPHEAILPPWDGGWIWGKDSLNRPWITVACQGIGASVWYPCKDHQSDEPDNGMSLSMIVPDSLVAVSNGRLKAKNDNGDGTITYSWIVRNPINNYNIIPYIGNYKKFHEVFNGEKGDLDLTYWVLDYNFEKAKKHLSPQVNRTLKCFENWFGPYPFYEDGYQIVDVQGYGMEHQSAIAYGNGYQNGNKGRDFSGSGWGKKWDFLIVHETAHEWFGNSITTYDIADKWVHESFAAYAEVLFLDDYFQKEAGTEYVIGMRRMIKNDTAIIAAYGINMEGSTDMYSKGRSLIHMIRTIINDDEIFKKILHDLNKEFYHSIVTTKDIENFINSKIQMDIAPIFDQYLRSTKEPILEYEIKSGILKYRFTNCFEHFTMPIIIYVNKKKTWITPNVKWQILRLREGNKVPYSFEVDSRFLLSVQKR